MASAPQTLRLCRERGTPFADGLIVLRRLRFFEKFASLLFGGDVLSGFQQHFSRAAVQRRFFVVVGQTYGLKIQVDGAAFARHVGRRRIVNFGQPDANVGIFRLDLQITLHVFRRGVRIVLPN